MGPIKLILPTEEWLDQAWAYRQEMLDVGSSMDGCGTLHRVNTPEQ